MGDIPYILDKKTIPPKPRCVYSGELESMRVRGIKKCPPVIIPENKLQITLPHKANNVGSPVTFIVNYQIPGEYVTGYEVYFGDDIVAGATPSQPLYKDELLDGKNKIVLSHTYSAPKYGGYEVVFVLHTVKGTYKTTVSVPISIAGDADGDGAVNVLDAVLVAEHIGASSGSASYDDRADLNNDDIIDIEDFRIVVENMPPSVYPEPPVRPLVAEPFVN